MRLGIHLTPQKPRLDRPRGKQHSFFKIQLEQSSHLACNAFVEVHHPGGLLKGLKSTEILNGSHHNDRNTYEQPNLITSQPFSAVTIQEVTANIEIPPLSIVALSLTC